jgi:predicted O-linked N-acetylglucosamine transferase (SPINDLY family)
VGRFWLPLLEQHDKREVEVWAYSDVNRPDGMTERLKAHTDGWRNTAALSDEQMAELIRADGIDVLVDLAMHAANNRLLVFARKPAPVQACWLAYPSSTGLTAMDYRVSDPYLDPVGMDESAYSERTLRLPETYWCYRPVEGMPEVGALPALTRGYVTFGCLNNFNKINEPLLRVWAEILRQVAGSQLLLHARQGSHRRWVQEVMEGAGVEAARVRFADSVPLMEYYGLYNTMDIALDPFPHGGGTTTCETLWMGVPTVSLAGQTAVGRGGASILSNVGLGEMVARSEVEYVRVAVELAGDQARLGELRAGLRGRMRASPLMDTARFARNMEGVYRQMWRAWCDGECRMHNSELIGAPGDSRVT